MIIVLAITIVTTSYTMAYYSKSNVRSRPYIILYYIMLYYIVLHYIILCYIMLYHSILYYSNLYHVMRNSIIYVSFEIAWL